MKPSTFEIHSKVFHSSQYVVWYCTSTVFGIVHLLCLVLYIDVVSYCTSTLFDIVHLRCLVS